MKLFLIAAFVFTVQNITAQTATVKKIYAYKQQILPGKKPGATEEVKTKEHFFMYAEVEKNKKVSVTGVWINYNYYNCTAKQQIKTPVQKNIMDGMEAYTFVPKTKNNVYELIAGKMQEPAPRPGRELGLLLQKNEVVVSYTYKGKQYYATAEKMIILESAPMM